MEGIRASKEYKKLDRALKKSLKDRGLTAPAYKDLAQEYMDCWVLRQQLEADIQERGVIVPDNRGGMTENRCVSLRIQTSRQMLTLLDKLGFKAEDLAIEDDDDL